MKIVMNYQNIMFVLSPPMENSKNEKMKNNMF